MQGRVPRFGHVAWHLICRKRGFIRCPHVDYAATLCAVRLDASKRRRRWGVGAQAANAESFGIRVFASIGACAGVVQSEGASSLHSHRSARLLIFVESSDAHHSQWQWFRYLRSMVLLPMEAWCKTVAFRRPPPCQPACPWECCQIGRGIRIIEIVQQYPYSEWRTMARAQMVGHHPWGGLELFVDVSQCRGWERCCSCKSFSSTTFATNHQGGWLEQFAWKRRHSAGSWEAAGSFFSEAQGVQWQWHPLGWVS